jgi:hypothetical protein
MQFGVGELILVMLAVVMVLVARLNMPEPAPASKRRAPPPPEQESVFADWTRVDWLMAFVATALGVSALALAARA